MISSVRRNTPRLTIKIITLSILMILVCNNNAADANEGNKKRGDGTQVPKKTIEQVLKEHTDDLMSLPGVVGTGQGLCNDQPCIKVFVSRKTEKLEQRIPKNLEGYPVVIQETGRFKALGDTKQ